MKNKITITDNLLINTIMIVDLKTNNVFHSQHLNTTIREYIDCCDLKFLFDEQPKLPHILNKTLSYELDSSGVTSKGYKYQASAYSYKGPDMMILLSVIEGIESEIGSDVYNLFVTEMN
jgi:hypothetical protein